MRYQIRDENFGLAIVEAETPREALYAFFADRVKGEIRPLVAEGDGSATVEYAGTTYSAVGAGP